MKKFNFIYTLFILGAISCLFMSNSFTPNDGLTGSTGSTCSNCHSGGNFGGSIAITGVPTSITPNAAYVVTVTINKTTGTSGRAGFELNVVNSAGAKFGTLSLPGTGVAVTSAAGTQQYAKHGSVQSFVNTGIGSKSWTFTWTAPATSTNNNITFYAAGLVANANNNTSGDQVVSTTFPTTFVPAVPLVVTEVSKTPVSCFGGNNGTATVSASGGSGCTNSFLWSNGQTSATATGLVAGTYTVTATCGPSTGTKSVVITQPSSALAGAATGSTLACFGNTNGTASIAAAGGTSPYSFLWSNTQVGASATNLSQGTYTVTITDARSCKLTRSAIVSNPAGTILSTTIAPTSANCIAGGTATANPTGGTSPYTYIWSSVQIGQIISGLSPNSYTVTVTDTNGCKANASTNITLDNTPPTANAGADATTNCQGNPVVLTASGGISYAWSNGGTLVSINVNPTLTSTYIVTVTGSNGCTATDETVVTYKLCSPRVNAKVFLSSVDPNTLLMGNALTTSMSFPSSDPYNVAPLNNYFTHVNNTASSVSPSVLSITGNNAIVDWLFLELRTGTSGTTTVAYTQAALLQADGDIVDTDGIAPLKFHNAVPGNYYLTIRHRNHLSFRTTNPTMLNDTPTTFDFTKATGPNTVALYGITPLNNIGNDLSMIGGDAIPDGSTDSSDSAIWEAQNGAFDDYTLNSDYNLDGSVDSTDSAIWELSNGKYQEID